MSVPERRTITKESPLTVKEIKNFVSQIKVGDKVPTIIVSEKHWTSTVNFEEYHRAAVVTIEKKFPHMVKTNVETNHGVMTWVDLILGYYTGTIPAMKIKPTKESKEIKVTKENKTTKTKSKKAA